MKVTHLAIICLAGLSTAFTSCTTRNPNDGAVIQSTRSSQVNVRQPEGAGQWQDRTFREMAY